MNHPRKRTILVGTIALGALLLAGATIAFADHGPRGGHMRGRHGDFEPGGALWASDRLAYALELDAAQRTAAKGLYEEFATQSEPLWTSIRDQHKEIHDLLTAARPDATAIGQKMIAGYQIREQLKSLRESFDARFSALLNADQRQEFEQIIEERRGHMEDGMRFERDEDRR